MPKRVIKETRILAEDEIIDISVTQVPVSSEIPHGVRYSFNYRIRAKEGWKTLIRFDNAHVIKGHSKRDHRHMFENLMNPEIFKNFRRVHQNEVHEINFNSPKELIDELMGLIEANRRKIDEIKRR